MVSWLLPVFEYSPLNPMLFTKMSFWIFFGVVLLGAAIVYPKVFWRNIIFLLFSLFFYFKVGGWFVLFLLAAVLINFFIGQLIGKAESAYRRKLRLILGLTLNLGWLIWLKYAVFFTGLINTFLGTDLKSFDLIAWAVNNIVGSSFNVHDILVPIGISFFTFQCLSYLIEVYRRKVEAVRSFPEFAAYITFFPNLISGPIMKANIFIPQIRQNNNISKEDFGMAGSLILTGLFKKIVIADFISGNFVDRVFDNPLLFTGFEQLMAVYGYTLQIYCDFSGYTDIAIGIALLIGIRLVPNFNDPYKAKNIADFWKRWHISLTNWFLDYLFLPLAYYFSDRLPRKRYLKIPTERIIYFIVTMVTFLLCGLWHGAAVNFVMWGGLHGLALVLHKFVFSKTSLFKKKKRIPVFITRVITFHFIVFTWIIFKSKDMDSVMLILNKIVTQFHPELMLKVMLAYKTIFLTMLMGFILIWLPDNWKASLKGKFVKCPAALKLFIAIVLVFIFYQFSASESQAFIYFQF